MGIPRDFQILFVGSATEAMERIIEGLAIESSHHFILGTFGEKWYKISEQLGRQPSVTRIHPEVDITPKLPTVPTKAELICVTLNETSVGALTPANQLKQLSKRPKNQFLAIDVVSAAPLIPVDWQHTDVAFFSVQKVFGLPAGLGVIIINEKALNQTEKLMKDGHITGSYHSLTSLAHSAGKYQTVETPNVLGIYLLERVAADMALQGLPSLRRQTFLRSQALYDVLESSTFFSPIVIDLPWRSPTVIVSDTRDTNIAFLAYLSKHNIIPGKGYLPEHKERYVRFANFPSIPESTFAEVIKHIQKWPV